jgi:hypothetical protein
LIIAAHLWRRMRSTKVLRQDFSGIEGLDPREIVEHQFLLDVLDLHSGHGVVPEHLTRVITDLGNDIRIDAVVTVLAFAHCFRLCFALTATHGPDKGTGENSLAGLGCGLFQPPEKQKAACDGGFGDVKYF